MNLDIYRRTSITLNEKNTEPHIFSDSYDFYLLTR